MSGVTCSSVGCWLIFNMCGSNMDFKWWRQAHGMLFFVAVHFDCVLCSSDEESERLLQAWCWAEVEILCNKPILCCLQFNSAFDIKSSGLELSAMLVLAKKMLPLMCIRTIKQPLVSSLVYRTWHRFCWFPPGIGVKMQISVWQTGHRASLKQTSKRTFPIMLLPLGNFLWWLWRKAPWLDLAVEGCWQGAYINSSMALFPPTTRI